MGGNNWDILFPDSRENKGGRNSANEITEYINSIDGTADYTSDDLGQLTGADYDYQTDESYAYDDNGNRTNMGYVTGANNLLLSDGTYRYTYDDSGNRTAKFVDTDADGVLDSGDTDITTYTWDYRNRLTGVVQTATYGGAVARCAKGEYVLDRYHVGIIGYGGEVWQGFPMEALAGDVLQPISRIAANPLHIEDRVQDEAAGAAGVRQRRIRFPIWFEPKAQGKTPMCSALRAAQGVLTEFISQL